MQACIMQTPTLRTSLALTVLCGMLVVITAATRFCPRQKLVVVKPEDLGVTHVRLYGDMTSNKTNHKDWVNFHAYVRLHRYFNSTKTRLYGIGWVEGPTTMPSYAPNHVEYLDGLPKMTLKPLDSGYKELPGLFPVDISIGSILNPDVQSGRWGFRLEAEFETPATFFEWRVEGWERMFPLHIHRTPVPGSICPWHAFDYPHTVCSTLPSGGRSRAAARKTIKAPEQTDPASVAAGEGSGEQSPVPLVAVVVFGRKPHDEQRGRVYAAQVLVRHIEYHLGQLAMQRVLVYCSLGLLYDPVFRGYLERYLPSPLLPYVTLVAWDSTSKTVDWYYDQHVKYYHAVTALWNYGNVLAALIDSDEYIAYPGPQVTLAEALARCNASHLDSVQLVNVNYVCSSCLSAYTALPGPHGGGTVDMDLWQGLAHADARWQALAEAGAAAQQSGNVSVVHRSQGEGRRVSWVRQCRWWMDDPLLRYNRIWNDQWHLEHREFTAKDLNTAKHWKLHLGKHLIRPEAARAFMHHHAEVMPGRSQAMLDPRFCPHIAHLVHLNGYRPLKSGHVKYYRDPERPADSWWMIKP